MTIINVFHEGEITTYYRHWPGTHVMPLGAYIQTLCAVPIDWAVVYMVKLDTGNTRKGWRFIPISEVPKEILLLALITQ